jgi:hypothetical protein
MSDKRKAGECSDETGPNRFVIPGYTKLKSSSA